MKSLILERKRKDADTGQSHQQKTKAKAWRKNMFCPLATVGSQRAKSTVLFLIQDSLLLALKIIIMFHVIERTFARVKVPPQAV